MKNENIDKKFYVDLDVAKASALRKHPFLAVVFYNMFRKVKLTRKVPTLAVSKRSLFINPEFFSGLAESLRESALCHEAMHLMLGHIVRGAKYRKSGSGPDGLPFDPKRWNYAADYIINYILKLSGMQIGSGWLLDPTISDGTQSCEEVYVEFKPEEGQRGGEGEGKEGEGEGEGKSDSPQFDDHEFEGEDDDEEAPSDAEIASTIAEAMEEAKKQGNLPGDIERMFKELLTPQVNWAERLRAEISRCAAREELTYTRINRRALSRWGGVGGKMPVIIEPGYGGFVCDEIAVIVDTSGSISQQEMNAFMSEVSAILSEVRPKNLILLACDAKVHEVYELDQPEDLESELKLSGGGGSNMSPAQQFIYAEGFQPAMVICLTDGWINYEGEDYPFPMIWVTTDRELETGVSIKLDIPRN